MRGYDKIELYQIKAGDIKTVFWNPRKIGESRLEELEKSFEMFGGFDIYLIDEYDNIVAGNQRLKVVLMSYSPDMILDCKKKRLTHTAVLGLMIFCCFPKLRYGTLCPPCIG